MCTKFEISYDEAYLYLIVCICVTNNVVQQSLIDKLSLHRHLEQNIWPGLATRWKAWLRSHTIETNIRLNTRGDIFI